jgi:sec-independent protein translocase protein TatC
MDQHNGEQHPGEGVPSQEGSQHDATPPPITYPDDPDSSLSPNIQPVIPPALTPEVIQKPKTAGTRNPPPPPPPPKDEEPDEDEGMLRMSFMDHLEELRSRLIKIIAGFAVAFLVCMVMGDPLWDFFDAPLRFALGKQGGREIATGLTDAFTIKWMWTPFVASLYIASPWLIYQIWAFIAPGLYPRERKWAGPFILVTAALFIGGGVFAYYIAFGNALVFLLSLGGKNIENAITIDGYFTTFVTVMLGSSLLFLMPVVVFFTTLLRLTTPAFLMKHSRYAILGIVTLAAVVTPTPDPINLAILAVPLILLFFLGVFGSYLLVLNREGQKFPWGAFFLWVAIVILLAAGIVGLMVTKYDYQLIQHWPFVVKRNIV